MSRLWSIVNSVGKALPLYPSESNPILVGSLLGIPHFQPAVLCQYFSSGLALEWQSFFFFFGNDSSLLEGGCVYICLETGRLGKGGNPNLFWCVYLNINEMTFAQACLFAGSASSKPGQNFVYQFSLGGLQDAGPSAPLEVGIGQGRSGVSEGSE